MANKTSRAEINFDFEGQFGQVEVVDKILSKKTSGFFIEAGACDGESISNSLFFEVRRKWSGLLVSTSTKTQKYDT